MIARAPRIGESFPIDFEVLSGSQFRQLPDDGRSPVNDCAKRVENKSLDSVKAHELTFAEPDQAHSAVLHSEVQVAS
jgi:hypothetical protein